MMLSLGLSELVEDVLFSIAPARPSSYFPARATGATRSCSLADADLSGFWSNLWAPTQEQRCAPVHVSVRGIERDDEESNSQHDTLNTSFLAKLPQAIVPMLALVPPGALWLGGGAAIVSGPAFLCHLGPLSVISSGLVVHTRTLCGINACILTAGACNMWARFPDEETRTPLRLLAAALSISALASLNSLYLPVPHLNIMIHTLPDIIIAPLILNGMGFIGGQSRAQMMPTMAFSVAGASALSAAAACPSLIGCKLLLLAGASCMAKVFWEVNTKWPSEAVGMGPGNRKRLQISSDVFVISWSGSVLIEYLGLFQYLTGPSAVQALILLDVLGKLGVCHLIVRNPQAYRKGVAASATQVTPSLRVQSVD